MDVQTLAKLFATTYDPNPNVRKAGELEIRKVGRQEGIITAVVQIIGSDSVELATRQACSVYLKNRVMKSYSMEGLRPRPGQDPIAQSDKDALKASIFPLLIAAPSKSISVQLSTTLRTIISHDFPQNWPTLIDTVKSLLSSGNSNEVTAGCIAVLEIIRVFRYRQTSNVLSGIVEQTFPQLVTIASHLLATPPSGPSQDIPTVLHLILKSYRHSISVQLSTHQQSPESLVPWGRLLFQVVNLQLPADAVPQDEEERERCEWWKAKKWAFSTLGRLFHRYGNPSQLPSTLKKDYGAFAEHFVTSFAPEIFKTCLHQVELYVSGQTWLSKKCQSHIFNFFTECVKPKSTWALLKPHFETLVSQYVFPQLSFTPEKQELWESDPVDFVRVSIDEYEDFAAPVSAATSFLLALAGNRTKTTFMPILGIINHALTSDVPPQQKYAALNMTSVLGGLMMRHPQVRPNIEQFLVQHVFPEFSNTMPYMRAIACEVLATVEKNDMKWANDENLAAASRFIATALNDPEIPVRVQAALALTEMITSHESVENAVRGDVGKVVQDLLKLSDETDLDILNNCMETMVERYHAELLPVATQLAARLCDTYVRLLNESIKQEESMDSENDFDKGFDSDAGDDDKTFAAMGVAKTIGTIISSVDSSPEILAQVEAVVSPIIIFTLEHKIIDLFDNVYDLIDALTFNLRRITPAQWKIFELTYNLFKADAIDFLDEMLPSLDNFISYGSDVIKANPEYKMMILDIYTTAMTADQLGENDRVDACKLIESFLLNLRGEVNDAIERIVVISFKELETASSRSLQLAILETLINVILYNPSAGLHIMETVDSNKTRKFFDKWFAAIKSNDGLPRVHDKKLTIVTLCALLELDPAAVPASLQSGWSGIVSAIIHVLKELPEAVEKRKTLEDAFVKGDDDEDDVEESELLTLTDDEDGDVRDEETDYIEMLAQEGARLRQTATKSTEEDAESYEDSEDEEEIDEELGYISPLEKVDPYVTFKQALTGLQTRNPAGYQIATTSLTVEEQTALMEMMAIAEKNASGAQ